MIGVLLQRPGDRRAQAAVLFIEHEPCGGVIVKGLLGGPERPAAVRKLLCRAHPGAGPAEPAHPDEVELVISSALGHMVDHGLELPSDVLPPVLVLQRALAGRRAGWPRPALSLGEEIEEALRAGGEALVDGFADAHGDEAALVADEMCCWKVDYVSGLPERWTVADLEEFLLDWYPRKGGGGQPLASVPDAVVAFLRFLDESGKLGGDGLETLVATVEQLRARFEREAADRRNWGPAKAIVKQMRAEGVDPAEPGALETWLAGFNARSFEERDRVLAPSLPRPAAPSSQRRKTQRRTAKASRKRNRR
jgi:hypothetical protein